MNEIQTLIHYCEEVGGLTLADLALLLDVPRCTVHTWKMGAIPRRNTKQHIARRMNKLVKRINTKDGHLVRDTLSPPKRKLLIKSIKYELFGLPEKDTSKRGDVLCNND